MINALLSAGAHHPAFGNSHPDGVQSWLGATEIARKQTQARAIDFGDLLTSSVRQRNKNDSVENCTSSFWLCLYSTSTL